MTPPADLRALEASGSGAWRWGLAAGVVAATYGALVWLAFAVPPPEGAVGALNEAVMIELDPVTAEIDSPPPAPEPMAEPVATETDTPPEPIPPPPEPPPAPEAEQTPSPPPAETEPAPPVEPEPPLAELPQVTQPLEPEPEKVEPDSEPEKPAREEPVPELPTMRTQSDAILDAPIPMARPTPPRPQRTERTKRPKPPPKRAAEVRTEKRDVPRQAAPAERSDSAPTRNAASAPRVSPASWQRQAVSHFRKFRRKVTTSTRGVARVAVTIDRGGRVLAARLASSSGNRDFDAEALALVRRASPIPAPPDGVGGRTVSLVVPVNM